MNTPQARAQAQALLPVLRALTDENRLLIVLLLASEPLSNRALQDATGMSQALVSHHVAVLRESGLLEVHSEGRSNIYELCCQPLGEAAQWLTRLASTTGGEGGR